MIAQPVMPDPLKRMLKHLDIDIQQGFESMPEGMEEAMLSCRRCKFFDTCDYDTESRYFLCPNRDIFDQLERQQGKA